MSQSLVAVMHRTKSQKPVVHRSSGIKVLADGRKYFIIHGPSSHVSKHEMFTDVLQILRANNIDTQYGWEPTE